MLQQACLAGAGLPIFFWARRQVGDLAALGLLVGYYLMPVTSRIAFSEFHPIVMAALPIALGVTAVLDGRARAAVVWLVLALLLEEETAPIVGAAGAYLWLSGRFFPHPTHLPRGEGVSYGGVASRLGRWRLPGCCC